MSDTPRPPTIVLATANPHKVAELRAILGSRGIDVLGLADLPGGATRFHEPDEHGSTFEANAEIKAFAYAEQTGRLCLADDSGLEVDALAGKPGVISSHYSTDGRETGLTRDQRDTANVARVLKELDGIPDEKRAARFVCCMCLVRPAGPHGPAAVLHRSRGACEGRIGVPPRVPAGPNGFGYDPIVLVAPALTQTVAELPTPEKNQLSHRARAAAQMATAISADQSLRRL
jgi:XTP/dITP diphosphohydrolase